MNRQLKILILFHLILTIKGLFKLTNIKCMEYDKTFATIPQCELKVIRRGVSAFNLNVTLHQIPVNNVTVRLTKYLFFYRKFHKNLVPVSDVCMERNGNFLMGLSLDNV